jgi:hypothetical protein
MSKLLRIAPLFALTTAVIAGSTYAQVKRPYRNGSVWQVSTIKVKPGMDTAYLEYLATDWKRLSDAAKKEGLILSYKVLVGEAHGATDWNLLLLTEYKDLASLEASEDKFEALAQRQVGDDAKQMQGYRNRAEIREVLGGRLLREIVLEPKGGAS